MESELQLAFKFDQKQRNTLHVSGLAAYVQHPPHDRIGWVHAKHVWLPEWQPDKWAYEVQHVEVTFQSYESLKRYDTEQLDHEPIEILMLTHYSSFLSDDLPTVEAFFARYTARVEWVQHPDNVDWPMEYANERLSQASPARWSLIRRAWVACLLCLQDQGLTIWWDTLLERLQGQVTKVNFNSFVLTTTSGQHHIWFSDRFEARLWHREEDGYVRVLWHEPSPHMSLLPEDLPVWNDVLEQWVPLTAEE